MTKAMLCFVGLSLAMGGMSVSAGDEVISTVMKDGFKGDDSPLAKVLDGDASEKETKDLAKMMHQLDGVEAPRGDQDAYAEKIAELLDAMDAVAGGDTGPKALDRLDDASSCKACHDPHKPKKK
ncbi:MAG: hypothetical protein HRU46_02540 [Verrucomicrobiales bacterium]|nr:hypothetical protein [Verrucomicrobiales bacterium]